MNDCNGNLYKNFFLFFTNFWVNFRWIIESNTGLPCFFFTSLFYWSRKPAQLQRSQTIRFKTRTNRDLATCVSRANSCLFYFELPLAPCYFTLF